MSLHFLITVVVVLVTIVCGIAMLLRFVQVRYLPRPRSRLTDVPQVLMSSAPVTQSQESVDRPTKARQVVVSSAFRRRAAPPARAFTPQQVPVPALLTGGISYPAAAEWALLGQVAIALSLVLIQLRGPHGTVLWESSRLVNQLAQWTILTAYLAITCSLLLTLSYARRLHRWGWHTIILLAILAGSFYVPGVVLVVFGLFGPTTPPYPLMVNGGGVRPPKPTALTTLGYVAALILGYLAMTAWWLLILVPDPRGKLLWKSSTLAHSMSSLAVWLALIDLTCCVGYALLRDGTLRRWVA